MADRFHVHFDRRHVEDRAYFEKEFIAKPSISDRP